MNDPCRGEKLLASITGGTILFAVAHPMLEPELPEWTSDQEPQYVIDSLEAPIRLEGWKADGLVTTDGLVLPVPGLDQLPERSALLQELVHRSVEVDPIDGRVYGLLPIWHSCGNDPVRLHLARVDVAEVLETAREEEYCDEVSENGWRDRCFYAYEERLAGRSPR